MLLKYKIQIVHYLSLKFSSEYLEAAKNTKRVFENAGIYKEKLISENLLGKFSRIEVVYSIDREQYFFNFTQDNEDSFNFKVVKGNPLPLSLFNFDEHSEDITVKNLVVETGTDSFEFGEGYILSHREFMEAHQDPEKFLVKKIQFGLEKIKHPTKSSQLNYISSLVAIEKKFKTLIFSHDTPELVLDKFLEENSVILSKALKLEELQHQIVLEDIHGEIGQNLKPDLIAYNLFMKEWVIVDYKKAKRNIIKNPNKIRTTFKSEVDDLHAQLRDYRDYFSDREHRKAFKRRYGFDLESPDTYGIIGIVLEKEKKDFKKLIQDKLRWFNIIPYNYILDDFSKYIVELKKEFEKAQDLN